jgi:hypothetical protein
MTLETKTLIYGALMMFGITSQAIILFQVTIQSKSVTLDKFLHIRGVAFGSWILWGSLSLILLIAFMQMITISKYQGILLTIETGISYIISAGILALLSIKLFLWFKSQRSFHILLYAVAVAFLTLNLLYTYAYYFNVLSSAMGNPSGYIVYHLGKSSSDPGYGPALKSVYIFFDIVPFVIMWLVTSIVMKYYSKKLGLIKYWVIICLPLVYFLGQFQPLVLNLLEPYRQMNPIPFANGYTKFNNLSEPGGGILFGIAFWSLARNFVNEKDIQNLLYFLGFGLLIYFSTNQVYLLSNFPYPPFGSISLSYLPLSSLLIFVGVYGSTLITAHDANIRLLIRKSIRDQGKLLYFLGSAAQEEEIYKRVLAATTKYEKNLQENVGVGTSLTENEVKSYIEEVIQEVKNESKIQEDPK